MPGEHMTKGYLQKFEKATKKAKKKSEILQTSVAVGITYFHIYQELRNSPN